MPETLKEFIEKKVEQFLDLHCIDGIIPTTVPGKNLYTEDVKAFLRTALREVAEKAWGESWKQHGLGKDLVQSFNDWLGTDQKN